ncbi:uncharacterized protein F5Z01DRAFT_463616 [Emericellopsis atlantica]|uniref:Protein BNI4 n=1 Tax=Emericellopsis atlantica TaxID=2614577 RepID=A0A9P7ZS43_9HYPO|nr:uncharacterized protein F5Z01DRAFT_463616 [Emericellopsis atlantica]KAG9257299.1 hypothetical protein F5Z01DRAFT_463616 [Emericellopsis atlantica]
MAALVQTYPPETATITMLQTRPTSATGRMPSGQQQPIPQYGGNQAPRSSYHSNTNFTGYRGSSTPVQQYAFQTTPTLNQPYRMNAAEYDPSVTHHRFPNYGPSVTNSSQGGTRDDTAILQARQAISVSRPQPTVIPGPAKNTPDRYRRPSNQGNSHNRSQSANLPNTSNLPNTAQFYNIGNSPRHTATSRPTSFYATIPGTSMDDMHLPPQNHQKGLRRRSMHGMETMASQQSDRALRPGLDNAAHSRSGSTESVNSSRSNHSRPSSANRSAPVPTSNPSPAASDDARHAPKQEQSAKQINVPPRDSSANVGKRTTTPSPLSKPVTMGAESADGAAPNTANLSSPAAKQLAAINQKGSKPKGKTSRLRRAFSFGSAAELRKVEEEAGAGQKPEPSRLHKEPSPYEAYDAEQARIAERQEAAGIGSSIYGGRFFGGSTDNLSISSTASSASIMIRKMGRGMKKSTRNLAGLFRPKSVIGVAPADGPVSQEGSQAAVSMVTVEAETQRVNVTADPQGSDSFPHLERNSIDANRLPEMTHERAGSSSTDNSNSRKSIVGGDKDRAEVLAAVRKGILKRSGSASPTVRPVDALPTLTSPPAITDSPNSSAPSTPNEEAQGHRRTGSVALGNEDYFMTALRLRQDTKSAPGTPQGSLKRSAKFSQRIVFHDTWPPQEYDRRGEVATCNRLTPLLAQQIKEELNTFKMEMEVHENSKIYTHFF